MVLCHFLSTKKVGKKRLSLLSVRTESSKESFKEELPHQFLLEYPPPMRSRVGDPFGIPMRCRKQWRSLPNSDMIIVTAARLG